MTTIAEFFTEFYAPAGPDSGVIELRCISHDKAHNTLQFFSDIPADLERQAIAWDMRARKSGVYFAVAMRKPDAVTGKKTDVSCVTALWVDIDVAKNGWDMQRTLGALKASPIRPSLVVNSGNGFHCYWLLHDPITIRNDEDIESVEALLRMLAEAFSGDKQATDITRVLRVPYTHNRKGDRALDVTLEVADWGVEYTPTDLAEALDKNNYVLAGGEWLSKEAIKERMKAARLDKTKSALAGRLFKVAGGTDERMSYAEVWRHTKYGGGSGAWIGVDEAILRATAILYARFGGEWPDGQIVDEVLANVKRIKERDAPNEAWNWRRERLEIQDKLERFKERWQAIREQENEKKSRSRKRTRDNGGNGTRRTKQRNPASA